MDSTLGWPEANKNLNGADVNNVHLGIAVITTVDNRSQRLIIIARTKVDLWRSLHITISLVCS